MKKTKKQDELELDNNQDLDEPDWWKDKADPVPVEIPAEMQRPETMDDRIKRIIREQLSPKMDEIGEETLEDAEDFDVKDEFETDNPITPYEIHDMEPEYPVEGSPVLPETAEPEIEGSPVSAQPELFDKDGNKITLQREENTNEISNQNDARLHDQTGKSE